MMAVREQSYKNYLTLDTENTTSNKGAAHDKRNRNVGISYHFNGDFGFTNDYKLIQSLVDQATDLVGFNFKYDLAWLRNVGIRVEHKRIWDTQIGEYLLTHQQTRYPSLNDCAIKYGLGEKIDKIAEYWDQGINTDQIPWKELEEYAIKDAQLTWDLFKVLDNLIGDKKTLWKLYGYDIIVLEDMERNGILISKDYQRSKKAELQERLELVESEIRKFIPPDIPNFNINSGDHLSALLYGGSILYQKRIPIGVYKTGIKQGQPRFQIERQVFVLPGMIKPLKGSELKKPGMYATDEATLLKLGDKSGLIPLLLEQAGLTKLIGTYFNYEELIEEMGWDNCIHSSFNHIVTNTGRLSSVRPNIQNCPPEVDYSFISRYDSSGR